MTGRHRSRRIRNENIGAIILVTAAIAVAIFVVIALADFRFSPVAWLVVAAIATMVLFGWIVVIGSIIDTGGSWERWGTVAVPPVLIALVLGLAASGWPYQARWALDRSEFTAAVHAIREGAPVEGYEGAELGTREVIKVTNAADGALLLFRVGGYWPLGCDEFGFGYADPEVDPKTIDFYEPHRFTNLGDGWWRYETCASVDSYK